MVLQLLVREVALQALRDIYDWYLDTAGIEIAERF